MKDSTTKHFRLVDTEAAIKLFIPRLEDAENGMEVDAILVAIQWLGRERDKCLPREDLTRRLAS